MIHDPEVLILDEPTDGLDPNQKHHVRSLINEMSRDKAIIVSTHILEEVEAVCTDTVIISDGKLVKSGTPEELLKSDPDHNSIVVLTKKKDATQVKDVLSTLGFVSEIGQRTARHNCLTFRVNTKKKAKSLSQVNKLIRDRDLPVEEVYMAKGALDKVFRQITTKAERRDGKNA